MHFSESASGYCDGRVSTLSGPMAVEFALSGLAGILQSRRNRKRSSLPFLVAAECYIAGNCKSTHMRRSASFLLPCAGTVDK